MVYEYGFPSEDESLLFIHCEPQDNSSELRSLLKPVAPPLSNMTILNSPAHLLALKSSKMPRLRQITCQVEWPEPGLKFEEYGTVYGDGLVETFIAVPGKPQPFSIH